MGTKARQTCVDLILVAAVTILGVFLIRKLFFLILPVGMGALFSEAIRSSFQKLRPVSPGVRRALIVLVLMILFAFLLLVGVLAAEKAVGAISSLGESLEGTASALTARVRQITQGLGKRLSVILHRDVETAVTDLLPAMLSEGAKRLASALPEWVAKIVGTVPALLASLVLFLFSGYYFSCEWDRARALFYRLCPAGMRGGVRRRKAGALRALKKLLRGYGLLFLVTFGELLAGFFALGIPGAVGKAFATALVDALPVFGCGTVLIPWAAALLLQKETARGIGLLVLYGVMFVARQFLEPRIVGKSIGLHPIVSLILAVGGLALFGIWGMFLLPLGAACLTEKGVPEDTP